MYFSVVGQYRKGKEICIVPVGQSYAYLVRSESSELDIIDFVFGCFLIELRSRVFTLVLCVHFYCLQVGA